LGSEELDGHIFARIVVLLDDTSVAILYRYHVSTNGETGDVVTPSVIDVP
jgi:hypothetical protein